MKVNKIILHHSATADSRTVSWGAIRRYHMVDRGWLAIGYHYGIELVDYDYEIMIGRFEDENGAHTVGQNKQAIGVCLVGNFDKMPVPQRQWKPALKLVRNILYRYDLSRSDVYGHRDFANKSCPGKHFDMKRFRGDL